MFIDLNTTLPLKSGFAVNAFNYQVNRVYEQPVLQSHAVHF